MKMRFFTTLIIILGILAMVAAYDKVSSFDGVNPPHAVDTDGKAIPESGATQPEKPLILAKDIPKNANSNWGELKPDAAFDHLKHHTDPLHTMDGKTLTKCVHCHHTEQPSAPGKPYLKRFNRNQELTAEQLETSKEPVKSCRACHYQKATPPTAEFPPKSVKYPKDVAKLMGDDESGDLDNYNAYHLRCTTCHSVAMNRPGRDPKLNAPTKCPECHIEKSVRRAPPIKARR